MASKLGRITIAILGLGALLGLAATNPTQDDYEAFAVDQARDYLKQEVCPQDIPFLGNSLEQECQNFLDSEANQPQLRSLIRNGTQRQNFILFSLYRTELSINSLFPFLPAGLVPAYEVKSVGLLRSLHIYGAETL